MSNAENKDPSELTANTASFMDALDALAEARVAITKFMISSKPDEENEEDGDAGYTITELATFQKRTRMLHDITDVEKKRLYAYHESFAKHRTPNKMEVEELSGARVDGIGLLSLRDDIYVKVSDKEALAEWLTDTGNDDLIAETVNASSLKSLIKKRLVAGEETPDCVTVDPYSHVVILK